MKADTVRILAYLRDAMADPGAFQKLESSLREFHDFEAGLAKLATSIDESMFPGAEWAEALETFLGNVPLTKIPSLCHMAGYLECCAQSQAGNPIQPAVPELVRQMLDEYGFEGA